MKMEGKTYNTETAEQFAIREEDGITTIVFIGEGEHWGYQYRKDEEGGYEGRFVYAEVVEETMFTAKIIVIDGEPLDFAKRIRKDSNIGMMMSNMTGAICH